MSTFESIVMVGVMSVPQGAVGAGPEALTIWDFAVKGGPTMVLIAACSLVALAVIVERLILTRRGAVSPGGLVAAIKRAADPGRALEVCKASRSALAVILASAIRHRSEPVEFRKKAVGETGKREIVRLRHRMRLLSALPQVATMLGLLGTILGMIKTFQAVAASGQSLGKTELLARGIFEAWACTAAGLLVAIPTLILYHVLQGRIDARVAELDRIATEFIEEQDVSGAGVGVAAPAASASAAAGAVVAGA